MGKNTGLGLAARLFWALKLLTYEYLHPDSLSHFVHHQKQEAMPAKRKQATSLQKYQKHIEKKKVPVV